MARSKERIGASIIWSHGIFGAASIAVLHVHMFAEKGRDMHVQLLL
jgi:hypothetical protein